MRVIQVSMDERLLRRIDALPEVKKLGRSRFLRTAAEQAMRTRRKREIAEAYRRGYCGYPPAEDEFAFDPEVLAWPDE